ncbi:MAG: hypothetical protein M3463_00760 [Verrucomicrobiota bacterium]|nr:hypothetical protein [Verrucomicrobiota bacterium]
MRHSAVLPWGPQANFYPVAEKPGQGAIAAGRTGRDFVTFGQAATQAGVPARIVCLDSHVVPEFAHFGANVSVQCASETRHLGYQALLPLFANAQVVAIPLFRTDNLAGLTSLMDALGMGKPVILTRNPLIDLEIEKLGIGRIVEPGDVDGWVDALRWFDAHPQEALQMGWRGRRLVDEGLNSAQFARNIASVFDAVLRRGR